MSSATLAVEQLSPHIGALITGVDLRKLSDAQTSRIRELLLSHIVLFFHDQQLEPDTLLQVAARFGTPVPYPFVDGLPGFPEVVAVTKLPEDTANFGGVWHSDSPYLPEPAMGALLYAQQVPRTGGDTLFANMYAALDDLSEGMREHLSGLRAVNRADTPDIVATRSGKSAHLSATHPVVRTHPETGRRSLYVSPAHTTRFEGMTEAESAPLLEWLFKHQVKEAFTCRFKWREGSVAFWDNRVCLHYPLNDYPGETRRMLRVSLGGGAP